MAFDAHVIGQAMPEFFTGALCPCLSVENDAFLMGIVFLILFDIMAFRTEYRSDLVWCAP